jgi:uncharacterized protein YraI
MKPDMHKQFSGYSNFRTLIRAALLLLVLALSACNLTSQPPTVPPEASLPPSLKPSVSISSPADGSTVAVNTQLFVTARATDSIGVTRVQLVANSQIVKTISSEAPAGQQDFPVLLDYTPRQTGAVTLQVIAYRGALASDPAIINLVVGQAQASMTPTIAVNTGGGGTTPIYIDPNDPTCRALTNSALNVRTGPATTFPLMQTTPNPLPAGTVVPIIGRVADNSWWQIASGFSKGWVSAAFTSVYGICVNVPIITTATITPTLTPFIAPSFTPTPKPPTLTPTPGKPDLVISSIGGPTSVTSPWGPVTYSVTITNTGSGPSGSFSNQVILPDGTSADLGTVSNLNAGESISLNIDVSFAGVGDYNLQANADVANEVTEVSEVNNSAIIAIKAV